jgi:hypothetical protein
MKTRRKSPAVRTPSNPFTPASFWVPGRLVVIPFPGEMGRPARCRIPLFPSVKGDSRKMGKWLGGILATICGGVVLWWLTHEGGPLNRQKPQAPLPAHVSIPAHIVITAFDVDPQPAHLNSTFSGRFTVYNDGESTAEDCLIYYGQKKPDEGGVSESSFGVPPKGSNTISTKLFWTGNDPKLPSIHVIAHARCKNGAVSDTTERVVEVGP